MSDWEKYLRQIYLDPSHPGSFGSALQLYKNVKKEGRYNISHSKIKKWIQKQESYSRNKKVTRQFKRGRVIVEGIDDQFDADLASLIDYSETNDGYKYLLVVIDIFSRYAWVQPLKDKSAVEIVKAFDKIISEGRIPKRLRTDAAKDFTSEKFQKYVNPYPADPFFQYFLLPPTCTKVTFLNICSTPPSVTIVHTFISSCTACQK